MSYITAQTERNKDILECIYEILRSGEWGSMQLFSTLHMLVQEEGHIPKTRSVDAEIDLHSTSVEAEHQSLSINVWVPPASNSHRDSKDNAPYPSSPHELIGIQSVLNMLIRKAGLRTNDSRVLLSHIEDKITKKPSIPGLVDLHDSIRLGSNHALIRYNLSYHADDRDKLLKAAKELLEELEKPAKAHSR